METQELNATREQLRIHLEDFAVHKEQPYKRVERLEEERQLHTNEKAFGYEK